MKLIFDPKHPRVRKARLAEYWLRPQQQTILWGILIVGLFVGVAGFVFITWQAAALFVPSLIVGMFLAWVHSDDVKGQRPKSAGNNEVLVLHDVLERTVLAKLRDPHNANDIWLAVRGDWKEQFFTVRYGLGRQIFDMFLPNEQADAEYVWEYSLQLARYEGKPMISAGAITVALTTLLPDYETFLAEKHITFEELTSGIDWLGHIEAVIQRSQQKNSFGGIARDWAAGYTPLLNKLGRNISADIEYGNGLLLRDSGAHKSIVDQIVLQLSQGGRPNIALVGPVGAGKTTLASAFAQRLLLDPNTPPNLRYKQVVTIDAASFVARARSMGSPEGLLIRMVNEAYSAKNIILFFDDAQLFFSDGPGAINLTNALTQVIESSPVKLLFTFSQQDWQRIAAQNPSLVGLMNYQVVAEADEQNTLRILEDQVLLIEQRHDVVITYQAIHEAYRLADRYLHDLAFPAKAIRVLEGAVNHSNGGLITEASVQLGIEGSLGVKVQTAGREEKLQLLNLEDQIHKRMINQNRAVSVVSDALRRARSGVNNPRRPIGTFLFLGPTGVGKTELAKAVAAAYFSGDDNIIRVDMNEYVRSADVARLLAPVEQNSSGLLAQIRQQPFAVVLFDEIEKAHPDVVNVFLQLLDEGVMRDINNKEVSFRDAVVIATSNAGADRIREEILAGRDLEQLEGQLVNELIDSNQFKPEFLNRFDEIVLFRPLKAEELLQVVDLMVAGLNKTLARQKVAVRLTDDAKHWLVDHGYDARLGARPLRRMVQRSVENIVARRLLEETFMSGSTLELTAADLEGFAQSSSY